MSALPPSLPRAESPGLFTRNRLGCLTILLFLGLCGSLLLNLIFAAASGSKALDREMPKFDEVLADPGEKGGLEAPRIVQISLRGLITSAIAGGIGETMVDDLRLQLAQAVSDPKVKAIVLSIDSPGGEVTASDLIYQAVAKAREKKPIVVCMGSVAASGGYYVSCGASYVIANETTATGSIGVIMQSLNYEQLFTKVGLRMVTVKSGKFKDMLSGSRPTTDEELAYVQSLIMESYDKFVGIVARERKQDEKGLREGLADGRVIFGKVALENKLIDALGTIEDAYAKARELGGAPHANVYRYQAPFKLGRIFGALGQSKMLSGEAAVQISLTESLKPKLEPGHLYYLPELMAP